MIFALLKEDLQRELYGCNNSGSMSSKLLLFLLVLAVLIGVSIFVLATGKSETAGYKPGVSAELDKAVNQAKLIYEQKKKGGVDFLNGPCLTNDLLPGWVADIAHNPRQKIDDLSENQCQAFREGRAKHFVELDPEGNVIQVQ